MGLFRLLLALCVVAGHTQTFFRPFFFVNAKAAVVCFFIVSGFYMALVLDGKYKSRVDFLANRWVRVYIPYLVMTLLYGTFLWAAGTLQLGWRGDFVNLTLIGQDAMRMLNWLPTPRDPLGVDVIVIPQAWTLSVELQLYLIAALLFGRGAAGIFTALVIGAALRTAMYFCNYVVAPYGAMLVLNVMVFFALGGAAYLAYGHVRKLRPVLNFGAAAAVLAALALYTYANNSFQSPMDAEGSDWRFLPLYGLVAILLPFLFAITRDSNVDRAIGNLSYPTYLVHIVVIDLANHIDFSHLSANVAHYAKAWFTLSGTLAVAAALHFSVVRPVDAWRSRRSAGAGSLTTIPAPLAASQMHQPYSPSHRQMTPLVTVVVTDKVCAASAEPAPAPALSA